MKRGKYEAPRAPKRRSSKKGLALLLSLVLVIGCVAGGTLAWLMAETGPVTNTFTVGDINISLVEHSYDTANNNMVTQTVSNTNSYPLLPGTTYGKDPTVSVDANSEDCWLFVKIDKINNPDNYLSYELETAGWTELEAGVYYREVQKADTIRSWQLLKGNDSHATGYVTVKETVVKAGTTTAGTVEMPAANAQPQLIFTAYAVQKANRTVDEAWGLVKGN